MECAPPGYSFTVHCRSGRKGGGIAVIHRSPILLTKITEGEKTSFEFEEYIVTSGSDKLRLVVVYRIPYSPVHPIGGLQQISRDTDNNAAMYNCWWTNKRS